MKKYLFRVTLSLALLLAGSLYAVDITWEGLNYNSGSSATDMNDGANWSSGTVPGVSDKAIIRMYSDSQGAVEGNLFIDSTTTNFNPNSLEYNGNFSLWYEITSYLAIDKNLDLTNGLVVTGTGSGGGGSVRLDRMRIGTLTNGVVINTSSFDITQSTGQGSPSWGFFNFGTGDSTANSGTQININGASVTFGTPTNNGDGSSILGGSEVDNATNTLNAQMRFTGVGATIHFAQAADRTEGVIGLGYVNLDMRSDQTFTADPLAFVTMFGSVGSAGNAGRFVVESIDGGRLDNLGDLNIKIFGPNSNSADATTAMRMQGGTYGSLMMSSNGTSGRTQRINQVDDVAFMAQVVDFVGGVPEQSGYGLALQNAAGNSDTQYYDLGEFNLDVAAGVRFYDTGSATTADRPLLILADNSDVTIGGDLYMDAPNRLPVNAFGGNTVQNQMGIDFGAAGGTLLIGGDFDTRVVSYSGRNNWINAEVTFTGDNNSIEIGDASSTIGLVLGSYGMGALNIGQTGDASMITLENAYLNNNTATTGDGNIDKVGEKLIVGDLSVAANSTFVTAGLPVEIATSLSLDVTAVLDLQTGLVLSDGMIVDSFVGLGDQTAVWSTFSNSVTDSSNASFNFVAVLDGGNTKWQAVIPEPSTAVLVGFGFGIWLMRRRKTVR